MHSLFRLLSQNTYWRMLLRKATWVEAWLSLRRSHKDRRARKHLLLLGLMLVMPVFCLVYFAWIVGSGTVFLLPFVLPVIWWRNRREKRDSVPLRIVPGPDSGKQNQSEAQRHAMRSYLADLALIYAAMVDRAGSEGFLKQKELPQGIEVTSRRVHLELLKKVDVWDKMAQPDREAMMLPDGHWNWDHINHVALGLEPLRLLRWMLRVDFYLPAIGQQLKGDYKWAHELVISPEKVLEGKDLIDTSEIRVGRDAALQFFHRCMAEAISRGYYDPGNAEASEWAREVSEALSGKQHEDFILGSSLVSEVTKEDLLWAISLSQRRKDFLTWAMSMLEVAHPPEPPFICVSCD